MGADVFVPFVFFGFLGAVILVPIWLKERTKQSAHALISQALEKGQQLDPALLRQLTEGATKPPKDRARSTLGSGVVLLALAIGFVIGGFAIRDFSGEVEPGMLVPAAILGTLAIAFIFLAMVDYASKKKEQ
ncbi:MAG TPA: DUF6249 domain-containing protein [Vitreimonas sp.]|uniref:DUF6249 domain-containing protein n=1 Tax=Vitreimonas sp. TaxID=3069702 RepID=UPI002D4CAEF4|nr:DUF6249 domain-containing protein [Vitreimonas sp.]HYD88064.1 DUF6249 domain-containing protein [Vitreimonas sp.]